MPAYQVRHLGAITDGRWVDVGSYDHTGALHKAASEAFSWLYDHEGDEEWFEIRVKGKRKAFRCAVACETIRRDIEVCVQGFAESGIHGRMDDYEHELGIA